MSTHKHFDKICCAVLAVVLLVTFLLMCFGSSVVEEDSSHIMGYESKLFDTSYVHSIEITMNDWDGFLETCTNEEYTVCNVTIDGETYNNVAIRAKGNTSLTQVASYGNNRYSFKIEFDRYDSGKNYHGLDKLCLNNIIQDNTYMKDYLVYQLMGDFGVAAPLCSYANISVNGEVFGLYLAVEGVEESFLTRNYGDEYGELYKPDSTSLGGGRGNGKDFEAEEETAPLETEKTETAEMPSDAQGNMPSDMPDMPDNAQGKMQGNMPGRMQGNMPNKMPENMPDGMPENAQGDMSENVPELPQDTDEATANDENRMNFGGNMTARGSDDVSLIYTDDAYDSYSNIFDNAKTDITNSDKDRLIASLKNINNNEDIETSVNVEEVIRYFVVHNFVLNFDSYTGSMIHNYYLYEQGGQLSMIPWDYNLAFSGFQSAGDAESLVNYPIDEPVSGGTVDSRPMLAWIFANEEYTELYHKLFAEFISQIFDKGSFEKLMTETVQMISPYVKDDPTKFCTYEEFEAGVQTLEEFCRLRAESISGQLCGTIGSTNEAQANSENFISAGNIDVSVMGSMNNNAGGQNRPNMQNVKNDEEETSQDGVDKDVFTRPNRGEISNSEEAVTDEKPTDFERTNTPGAQNMSGSVKTESIVVVAVTVVTLIIGLSVAFLYKRKH